jgi:hypothetical protein
LAYYRKIDQAANCPLHALCTVDKRGMVYGMGMGEQTTRFCGASLRTFGEPYPGRASKEREITMRLRFT